MNGKKKSSFVFVQATLFRKGLLKTYTSGNLVKTPQTGVCSALCPPFVALCLSPSKHVEDTTKRQFQEDANMAVNTGLNMHGFSFFVIFFCLEAF